MWEQRHHIASNRLIGKTSTLLFSVRTYNVASERGSLSVTAAVISCQLCNEGQSSRQLPAASLFLPRLVGGFIPPLGRGDPCALTEPCTKPCTTATPLPCMAHLCFIPHPLTGRRHLRDGSQSGPSVMIKQLCDSSLGISAIPFLRSSNQLFAPGLNWPSFSS